MGQRKEENIWELVTPSEKKPLWGASLKFFCWKEDAFPFGSSNACVYAASSRRNSRREPAHIVGWCVLWPCVQSHVDVSQFPDWWHIPRSPPYILPQTSKFLGVVLQLTGSGLFFCEWFCTEFDQNQDSCSPYHAIVVRNRTQFHSSLLALFIGHWTCEAKHIITRKYVTWVIFSTLP